MKFRKLLFLIFFALCFICESYGQARVKLIGTVQGRQSDTLLLSAVTTSKRDNNKIVRIPINQGKFEYEYELNTTDMQAYQLVFLDEMRNGAWRQIIFFPDADVIRFTLHPMDAFDSNSVEGGQLNKTYTEIQKQVTDRFRKSNDLLIEKRNELIKAGNLRSKEDAAVVAKLKNAKTQEERIPIYEEMDELHKTGADYTDAGKELNLRFDSLSMETFRFKYALMDKAINIATYYMLWYDATTAAKVKRDVAEIVLRKYPVFSALFPNHPYTSEVKNIIGGIVQVVPGNSYIDFTAPALDGKMFTLSEQIKGKVAVIDLWASWCGPCIAKAKALVPVYNRYKNKGFTVVGIAREFKNLNALKFRLKQEKFGWLQLTELDDKEGIWKKYAIGDGGGMQVLVDQQGKILKVNPSAEDVESYIKQLLKI